MSKAYKKLNTWLEKQKKEKKEFLEKLGEKMGYIEKSCINCGENRVLKFSSGTKICEKCKFDQDKKEYNYQVVSYLVI